MCICFVLFIALGIWTKAYQYFYFHNILDIKKMQFLILQNYEVLFVVAIFYREILIFTDKL